MKSKRRGFTLLEIIAAITLMLVIVSVAMPVYGGIVKDQKLKTDKVTAMQIAQLAKTHVMEDDEATQETIKEYVKKNYGGEMPTAESSDKEFTIEYTSDKKVLVKLGTTVLVENGKLK